MKLRRVAGTAKEQAQRELLDAARAFERAKAALNRQRTELHRRIVAASRAGNTKSQIARDTGYTREYVTKLIDDAAKLEAQPDEVNSLP